MYLVHAHVRAPLPITGPRVASMFAIKDELASLPHIRHIVVHAMGGNTAVLGVYVVAQSLDDAETAIRDDITRVLLARATVRDWTIERCEVVLLTPRYDWPPPSAELD